MPLFERGKMNFFSFEGKGSELLGLKSLVGFVKGPFRQGVKRHIAKGHRKGTHLGTQGRGSPYGRKKCKSNFIGSRE